MKNSKRN